MMPRLLVASETSNNAPSVIGINTSAYQIIKLTSLELFSRLSLSLSRLKPQHLSVTLVSFSGILTTCQ